MRLITAALMMLSIPPAVSHAELPAKTVHMAFTCREVSAIASAYLIQHGLYAVGKREGNGLSIMGRASAPWTDAQGRKINDFRIYWLFSDKKSDDKLPFPLWHVRLSHYRPAGEMKAVDGDSGCDVVFNLSFQTDGANVIGVLPVDSRWDLGSNGRMEREYMGGITAELVRHGSAPAKSADAGPPRPGHYECFVARPGFTLHAATE